MSSTTSRSGRFHDSVRALPWLAPALVLITTIVVFPAGYMAWTSTRELSQFGVDRGSAGLDNYTRLLAFDPLPRVLLNTLVWVVGVVVVTVLVSMVLARFLATAFPGRRIVRLSLIIPWAASVVMTTTVFAYGLDPFYGIMNRMLVDVGILDAPYGFTKNALPAFAVSMAVAIFVSLPFTTYTLLAGLQTIPGDVIEAAEVDGASHRQIFGHVILPLLRPALAVATIINIINVFNNLPILQILTGSLPGNDADTTTTLIFKFIRAQLEVDTASALSVVNFLFILVIIAIYMVVLRPMRQD